MFTHYHSETCRDGEQPLLEVDAVEKGEEEREEDAWQGVGGAWGAWEGVGWPWGAWEGARWPWGAHQVEEEVAVSGEVWWPCWEEDPLVGQEACETTHTHTNRIHIL